MIEFHIRHATDNLYTAKLIKQIKELKQLELKGPFGNMRYQKEPPYPLLFLAAGTGLAPCKAIIEKALKDKNHSDIYLYWGARKKEDLYWHDELIKLKTKIKNFYYIPVLSSEGRVYEVVLKNHHDLSQFHIYASGPSEMVFEAQKAFNYPKYFYSDWLNFSSSLSTI
jgi:CDP-4-dehydro-6-deoxyglucose reductase